MNPREEPGSDGHTGGIIIGEPGDPEPFTNDEEEDVDATTAGYFVPDHESGEWDDWDGIPDSPPDDDPGAEHDDIDESQDDEEE